MSAGGHSHGRGALTARAALASTALAVALVALKAWAAWATGSVAMLGSLADSGFDLVASLITLYAVRVAARPADAAHRFGHGKAEALAALVQVGLISVSAIGILVRAVERLRQGAGTEAPELGIGVSMIAIAATLALLAYQRRVIARTGSVAIRADQVHYQSDLLLNGGVILALALDHFARLPGADAWFGIAIALYLAWGAWRASTHAIDQLMDREWPDERRAAFLELANAHPEVRGVHDLRTRTSGAQDFAQFHIWVDPAISVRAGHDIVDAVEARLRHAFPAVEILIHVDPEGHVDPQGPAQRGTD